MSTPIERLAARWRRTPRVAIPADAARRAVEHDATHAGGGYLMPSRLNSPIPDNLHGVVQEVSVAVDHPAYSLDTNLYDLLEQIISDLDAATEATATLAPNYVYWTPDTSATDPEWLTYQGANLRWEE